ncbi:MAG: redoxin domain-containing protein [Deltaproteobacteria bacterium]|nr:redoxin domain-containing protein [Candidatus Tharpellaceae bacterium]MCK4378517.1 redoxin domain-containing protein [Deltaproteobacteria bacterium]
MTAVAARYNEFKDLDVEVMAISVDSVFVHKIWQEEELSKMVDGGVPYPLLSDGAGSLGKIYGVYDETAGVDVRGRFLIDPDGVVQAMEILTPPVGRSVDETLRQIQAFQHVRKTGGSEVCPSGWTPGKTVLNPGPDLVGKVWKVWKPE